MKHSAMVSIAAPCENCRAYQMNGVCAVEYQAACCTVDIKFYCRKCCPFCGVRASTEWNQPAPAGTTGGEQTDLGF